MTNKLAAAQHAEQKEINGMRPGSGQKIEIVVLFYFGVEVKKMVKKESQWRIGRKWRKGITKVRVLGKFFKNVSDILAQPFLFKKHTYCSKDEVCHFKKK